MERPPALEEHLFAADTKRILALDGGGVRGIITIAFLERIEALLKERSGRGNDFRLSDYFDLVGGTSVGSILATLIALGYPVADIKRLFIEWCPSIFRRPWLGIPFLSPRFSSAGLKKKTRRVLQEGTLSTAPLKTGLAIVTKRIDTGSPWVLSNNPRSKYWDDPADASYLGNRNYRIADLIRASTAAPYYFAPKRIPISRQRGLFVDGGVSPYNNPSLLMLMLAGIRGYGYQWHLGADHLLIVSVGTGSYRVSYKPGFFSRNVSTLFAAQALRGLIGDNETLSLTLLQWLSAPDRPWEINSEIGNLADELLGPADMGGEAKPLLSFVRYDARLEEKWLREACGQEVTRRLTSDYLAALQRLDRPDMLMEMYRVGAEAAAAQVTPDNFPSRFDQ
ncbi:MAG: patatin-like phospholipase family protein [Hyphomicrobium sp.]|jgi:hypothetical protein